MSDDMTKREREGKPEEAEEAADKQAQSSKGSKARASVYVRPWGYTDAEIEAAQIDAERLGYRSSRMLHQEVRP